jgi:hypothetical protein
VAKLSVPSCLLREEKAGETAESLEPVSKLEILRLAVRCYSRAIHGQASNSCCWSLWHQLGLSFGGLARLETGRGHEASAMRALKQALRLAPGQRLAWISLGAVACQLEDWPLAQHAFIK